MVSNILLITGPIVTPLDFGSLTECPFFGNVNNIRVFQLSGYGQLNIPFINLLITFNNAGGAIENITGAIESKLHPILFFLTANSTSFIDISESVISENLSYS